ncbi:MAG: LCP family protein [Scrofimicrobium sp.]
MLVALIAWPVWLVNHVDKSMNRVDALSGGPDTPGTTYLFAGSDSRDNWTDEQDDTEGERSDSMILVHKAENGQTAMVSLPRDTYVDIPYVGWNKLNAAFSLGGPQLAIETVEQMTGLTVDHYVQIGMLGVGDIVDALGGVNLCWDQDVSDEFSGMQWTAGCHDVNGTEALAFARMRYEDPLGDVGRTMRQRQILGAVSDKALSWKTLINPFEQLKLGNAASSALTVDNDTKIWNVGFLLLAMRSASADGLTGAPPMWDYNAMMDVGSVMLLDEDLAPVFFQKLADGTLTPEDFDQPL